MYPEHTTSDRKLGPEGYPVKNSGKCVVPNQKNLSPVTQSVGVQLGVSCLPGTRPSSEWSEFVLFHPVSGTEGSRSSSSHTY